MNTLGSAVAAAVVVAGTALMAPVTASGAVTGTGHDSQLAAARASASASSCLQGLSGPYDEVNSYNGVTLYCGDETKGVLHIDKSHPIAEDGSDDVDVERCMNNILAYGKPTSSGEANSALKITNSSGGYAIIAWDSGSKNVVTMYTSDNNNWSACAAFG